MSSGCSPRAAPRSIAPPAHAYQRELPAALLFQAARHGHFAHGDPGAQLLTELAVREVCALGHRRQHECALEGIAQGGHATLSAGPDRLARPFVLVAMGKVAAQLELGYIRCRKHHDPKNTMTKKSFGAIVLDRSAGGPVGCAGREDRHQQRVEGDGRRRPELRDVLWRGRELQPRPEQQQQRAVADGRTLNDYVRLD